MHHPTIVPNVHDPRAYNNYRFSSVSVDSGRGSSETTFTNKVFFVLIKDNEYVDVDYMTWIFLFTEWTTKFIIIESESCFNTKL